MRKWWHWFLDEVLDRCPGCRQKLGCAVFGNLKTPRAFCSPDCMDKVGV